MISPINNIVTEFQLFYQKILNIYNSDKSIVEKWNDISTDIHENNSVITNIFTAIKHQDTRHQIKMDYSLSLPQLKDQIENEADPVVKTSVIILSMHIIIYDLISAEGNYYFTLDGQEEMRILKKKLTYYINLSTKPEHNNQFHAYILLYSLESLFNKHFYIGVDYEYTNKKIQLGQYNFEHNVALQSIIWMVRPNNLDAIITDNLIELIICNKYIKKILHGSDSLDIPYMYNHMLQDDPKKIQRFTRTLIDTRFLCEYYKLTRDQVSDNKCSIYSQDSTRSAIYYFGVVSDEQQQKLADLLESMPASFDIAWDIKLPKSQVLYAQYDVIYLKYFYYRMIYVATEDDPTPLGKKSIIDLYKHVLNEITRFVYLERNDITFLMKKCKEEVDVANNYFIKTKNGIVKMIDVYNKESVGLETVNPKVSIDKLAKVNHFKIPIMTLIKRIVYGHISYKCRVQKDKSTIWTDKLDNQFIFDFLEKMEYNYLNRMFRELNAILEARVRQICS